MNSAPKPIRRIRPEFLVWSAALCAFFLKLYCAWTTIGITDVFLHMFYGRKLAVSGLTAMYQATEATAVFNHTPLIAGYFAATYKLSAFLGPKLPFLAAYLPPHEAFIFPHLLRLLSSTFPFLAAPFSASESFLFPFLLRVPPIVADLLAVWIILRIRRKIGEPPVWAICVFALSPVSFMVSGYHGNFDSMMVLFLLLAAWMCVEERPMLCALFLGISCNIKIISILIGPIFFFFWFHRREGWRFALCTGAVCLIGWSPALLCCPRLFVHNVLEYGSYWGIWGITYWLRSTHLPAFNHITFTGLTTAQKVTMNILKYAVILCVMALAWMRRALPPKALLSTIAYAWAAFFILAPGACAQYMVWPAPFILLCSTEWYIALVLTSSLFLFQFYNTMSVNTKGEFGMPWFYGLSVNQLTPRWVLWTNLPWATFFAGLVIVAFVNERGRTQLAASKCDPSPHPLLPEI